MSKFAPRQSRRDTANGALEAAIEATLTDHASWEIRFQSAIHNRRKLGAHGIRCDKDCALGQWLIHYGAGAAGDPEHAACRVAHMKYHAEAEFVAKCINTGDYARASRALEDGGRYAGVAKELSRIARRLRHIEDEADGRECA